MKRFHGMIWGMGLAACVPAQAWQEVVAIKPRVAVLDLKVSGGVEGTGAEALAGAIRAEIHACGLYTLIDRDLMKERMAEIDWASSAECDQIRCLVEAGKSLDAQKIIGGLASSFDDVWTLELKAVDVVTGELENTVFRAHQGPMKDLLGLAPDAARELLGLPLLDPSPIHEEPQPPPVPPTEPPSTGSPPSSGGSGTPPKQPAGSVGRRGLPQKRSEPPPTVPSPVRPGLNITKPIAVSPYKILQLGAGVTMKLIRVPAGQFLMGSPETEPGRAGWEGPQRRMTVDRPFYLGQYEVTQAQWEAVMGYNPSRFRHPNLPVDSVRRNQALEFCDRLSRLTRVPVRLPREAEWEYACRAGTATARFFDPLPAARVDDYAWHGGITNRPRTIGLRKPNPWGLYDMYGNVGEWCQESFQEYSHRGAGVHADRYVVRGGSYEDPPDSCRSAARAATPGDLSQGKSGVGLRVVVETD